MPILFLMYFANHGIKSRNNFGLMIFNLLRQQETIIRNQGAFNDGTLVKDSEVWELKTDKSRMSTR